MSLLNWIVLILSVIVHIRCQIVGGGIAMASSTEKDNSKESIYLDRLEIANGIAQLGAYLSFISQLVPVDWVKSVGVAILVVALVSTVLLHSGLLEYGLRDHDDHP